MIFMNTYVIKEQSEIQSESRLNFENEESINHQNLAEEDLNTAKVLFEDMKKYEKYKKGIARNAVKTTFESTEHSLKAVSCADERKDIILSGDTETREKYDTTHNLNFLQREQKKAKIEIISKDDVKKITRAVKSRRTHSPYNDVRYIQQSTSEEAVQDAIEVAEKAFGNMKELKEKQSTETIEFDGVSVTFPKIS